MTTGLTTAAMLAVMLLHAVWASIVLLRRELLKRSAGERSKSERCHRQFVLASKVVQCYGCPDPEAAPERGIQDRCCPDRGDTWWGEETGADRYMIWGSSGGDLMPSRPAAV